MFKVLATENSKCYCYLPLEIVKDLFTNAPSQRCRKKTKHAVFKNGHLGEDILANMCRLILYTTFSEVVNEEGAKF